MNYPNSAELLTLITNNKFVPFSDSDYHLWSGVTSKNPLICETEEYTIVIDGHIVNILHADDEYGGQLYSLIEGL